jgi:aminomethyltransferase
VKPRISSTRIAFPLSFRFRSSFRGRTATAFLEWITPSSLSSLPPYTSTLSVILNESGGIIDDTIVTKHADDAFYVVTNAGRRDRDLAWFREKLQEWNNSERARDGRVELETLDGWGLVALQGQFSVVNSFLGSLGNF